MNLWLMEQEASIIMLTREDQAFFLYLHITDYFRKQYLYTKIRKMLKILSDLWMQRGVNLSVHTKVVKM